MAADWTYGKEGKAFPVQPEEVWQCGNHVYVCSDLMSSRAFSKLLDQYSPTVVYCDPPWGQGLANGFRTKAGLDRATYDWTDIYRKVAGFGHLHAAPVWVECSSIYTEFGAPVPALITMDWDGPFERGYWDITYFGEHPSGLYYAGRDPHPQVELEGLTGFEITSAVLSYYEGRVLDACSGLGGVPLEAEKLGLKSINNELSQWRMSKALWRMRELTGIEPERVS